MTTATMKDGAKIYFKDWGAGPVVTFSHGWPLTADALAGFSLSSSRRAGGRFSSSSLFGMKAQPWAYLSAGRDPRLRRVVAATHGSRAGRLLASW